MSDWGLGGRAPRQRRTQRAVRSITRQPYMGGQACPKLFREQLCAKNKCPVHCKVAPWSVWSRCSRKCGYGFKVRTRLVEVRPKYGAKPCPKLRETRKCNSFPCAGLGPPKPCGGTTIKGQTAWRIFNTHGIFAEVDTKECKFNAKTARGYEIVPFYVASVLGHDAKFTVTSSYTRRTGEASESSFGSRVLRLGAMVLPQDTSGASAGSACVVELWTHNAWQEWMDSASTDGALNIHW